MPPSEYHGIALPHDDAGPGDRHARGMALALHDHPTHTTAAPPRSADRPRYRLGRRAHRALLVAHVLSAVGWFGLAVTVAFVAVAGGRAQDVAYSEVIGSTLWLSIPLGLTAALTGVALSVTTRWGLVRHWWVVAKEAITIAVIATDVLVVWPEMDRAVDTGTPGSIPGPVYAHGVVLAIATALSVVKPKARTPLAPRR